MVRFYSQKGTEANGNSKINMSWHAFSEIRDKYSDRVLGEINAGVLPTRGIDDPDCE